MDLLWIRQSLFLKASGGQNDNLGNNSAGKRKMKRKKARMHKHFSRIPEHSIPTALPGTPSTIADINFIHSPRRQHQFSNPL
jgi:hypothetical protein